MTTIITKDGTEIYYKDWGEGPAVTFSHGWPLTADAWDGQLARAGVKAHGEVRNTIFGSAAREILADAKAHDAGVIVMGSKGRGDLAGLLLGSTAHKVIHLSDRPVLVVR